MSRILVSYASATGTTESVATELGAELRRLGHDVVVRPCRTAPASYAFDAVVIGSSVHHHRWLAEAMRYLQAEAPDLAERPTWLFQTGPCADGEEGGHVGATPVPDQVLRYALDIGAAGPATFSRPDDTWNRGTRPTWTGTGPCFGPFGDEDGVRAWAAVISSWTEHHHAPAASGADRPAGDDAARRDPALV
jgi:menaquinone-dependent protoporphyrinogen oxidase